MTYDELIPGIRVFIVVSSRRLEASPSGASPTNPEENLGGEVGQMFDGEPPTKIVRFDNGVIVKVKEEHAHLFCREPLN